MPEGDFDSAVNSICSRCYISSLINYHKVSAYFIVSEDDEFEAMNHDLVGGGGGRTGGAHPAGSTNVNAQLSTKILTRLLSYVSKRARGATSLNRT